MKNLIIKIVFTVLSVIIAFVFSFKFLTYKTSTEGSVLYKEIDVAENESVVIKYNNFNSFLNRLYSIDEKDKKIEYVFLGSLKNGNADYLKKANEKYKEKGKIILYYKNINEKSVQEWMKEKNQTYYKIEEKEAVLLNIYNEKIIEFIDYKKLSENEKLSQK